MNKFSLPIAHQALLFSIALSSSRREYRTATAALEAAQPQRSTRLHQNALQHDALRRNKPLRPSTLPSYVIEGNAADQSRRKFLSMQCSEHRMLRFMRLWQSLYGGKQWTCLQLSSSPRC